MLTVVLLGSFPVSSILRFRWCCNRREREDVFATPMKCVGSTQKPKLRIFSTSKVLIKVYVFPCLYAHIHDWSS